MSKTFSLVCRDAKLKIWVGQSGGSADGMLNFYSGMPEVMQRLGRFLEATRGKPLALLCNDTQGDQYENCAEFEDQDASEDEAPNT
mgnify:CR=1 FL=1